MGRIPLSFFKKISPLFILIFSLGAFALEKNGVKLDQTKTCLGETVPLQGAGLRTATIFGVKIYVLSYYASGSASREVPYLEARPACFEIHYLREFDKKDVDRAWDFQFKESSMHAYQSESQDRELLKKFFGDIKKGSTHLFELGKGETFLRENGELKGKITGEDFQKSFISIWFGKKPPTEDLQTELLGGLK